MRYSILTSLILITADVVGQGGKNPFYRDTITVVTEKCRLEINRAMSDYEKNVFVIELEKPIPFTDTQQKILYEKYGIQTAYRSGLISPNYDCYNFHLKTLAKEKWRHDIFKRSKTIADSLDKIGVGDRQVKFRSGHGEFDNFIKTNLSRKTLKELQEQHEMQTMYVKVDISETGDVDNVKIANSLNFGDIELEILKLLKGKQLWIPETDNGIGVKTWIIYPVKVDDW